MQSMCTYCGKDFAACVAQIKATRGREDDKHISMWQRLFWCSMAATGNILKQHLTVKHMCSHCNHCLDFQGHSKSPVCTHVHFSLHHVQCTINTCVQYLSTIHDITNNQPVHSGSHDQQKYCRPHMIVTNNVGQ